MQTSATRAHALLELATVLRGSKLARTRIGQRTYASNDLSALSPEFWVAEGMRILREELVVAPLFSTDYSAEITKAGKIIHVHKRGEVYARRKLPTVDVAASNLSDTGTLIRLDQQPYVHYAVEDIEQAVSLGDVVQDFIEPCFFAEARYVDQVCALQCYDFFRNQAGGDLTNSLSYNSLVDGAKVLNILKNPRRERGIVINSNAEAALLKENLLTKYDSIGDGSRLLNGQIASGAGFAIVPSLHMPIDTDYLQAVTTAGAVNHTGGYGRGIKTMAVDGITGAIDVGTFFLVSTGGTTYSIHQVCSQHATQGNTDAITFVPGLPRPVTNDAAITFFDTGTVGVAHDAQYAGLVRITAPTGMVPSELGGISFSADGPVYGILSVVPVTGDTYDLELNRPLDEAITTNSLACFFPPVPINWSFLRDAVTRVGRPMRIPRGAASAALGTVLDLALRVIIGYDMKAQEELVTIDTLFGVKTLDKDKGMIMIG